MLVPAIRLYRKSRTVKTAVRLSVRAHHVLRPHGPRAVCPFRGRCSEEGLTAAMALGMAALPPILARMAACSIGEGYTAEPPVAGCPLSLSLPHPMEDTSC
jgi:hypothetical protein